MSAGGGSRDGSGGSSDNSGGSSDGSGGRSGSSDGSSDDSSEENEIDEVCVLVQGNGAEVSIEVRAEVDELYYIGAGNDSKGSINVIQSFELEELGVILLGVNSSLSVSGEGNHPCPTPKNSHPSSSFTCL